MGIHRSIVVSQHLNDCYFRHRYTLRAPLQPTRKQTGASWTPILYLSEQVRGLGATRCHAPKEGKRRESRSCFFFFSLSELSQRFLEWSFEAKLSLFLSFSRSSLSTRATHSHNSPLKLAAMASALAFSSCTSAVLSQQQQRRGNSSTVVVAASKARCASIASAVVASSTKPRRCVVAFILDLTRISIAANRAHRKLSLATKKGVSKSSR